MPGYSKEDKIGILYENGKLKEICEECHINMSKLKKEDHKAIQNLIEKDNNPGMR